MESSSDFSGRAQRGYVPPQNDGERLLQRRVTELVLAVQHGAPARTTSFLSDREQALAQAALRRQQWDGFAFLGGYDGAERRLLCVYDGTLPDGAFCAQCLRIEPQRPQRALTHRDYLGALLSLGIRRECLGDIVVEDGGCAASAFVLDTVAPLVLEELSDVGRCTVRVSQVQAVQGGASSGQEKTASISSLRLDALIAAMLHVSRGQAAALIKGGAVAVNHVETACVHGAVYEDDVFSVRSQGKFKLCRIGAQSKKGRTFVSYLQY